VIFLFDLLRDKGCSLDLDEEGSSFPPFVPSCRSTSLSETSRDRSKDEGIVFRSITERRGIKSRVNENPSLDPACSCQGFVSERETLSGIIRPRVSMNLPLRYRIEIALHDSIDGEEKHRRIRFKLVL